jgi:hypothetical protein
MAESKDTAVAVVQDRSRQNAIVGTIKEQMDAFDQISANLSQLGLNGWDTVPACKAACWLAHGAGMHPAIFIQNHYVMRVQNRLLVEPKWEFIVGILQSRLPGFKWSVLIETDDCAEVRMTDATGADHTVRYSLEDARRQGLLSRGGNAWTSGNTREMCLKQAVKRCGRRIGAAALMDLPVSEFEALSSEPSVAEVVGAAISKAGKKDATDVAFEEEGAEASSFSGTSELTGAASSAPSKVSAPESPDTARRRLGVLMVRLFGRLSKAVMAEKVNVLYNAMMLEKTGVDPKMSFKPGQIGPSEAQQLIERLEAKLDNTPEASEAVESGEAVRLSSPPVEDVDEPPPAEEPAVETGTQQAAYDELNVTIARARKLFNRQFVVESPAGSGKFWFNDMATFAQIGDEVSIKLQVGPDVVATVEKMEALNGVLADACDAKERGGR